MDSPALVTDSATDVTDASVTPPAADAVLEDLLVEDVSIDGMCGVY